MTILVVTPLEAEQRFLTAAFGNRGFAIDERQFGPVKGHHIESLGVTTALGGHGKAQCAAQTRYLLDILQDIGLVICAGAAGSITPELAVGDTIVATTTVEHDYQLKFVERELPAFPGHNDSISALRRVARSVASPVHFGIVASGDEDVVDTPRANVLREQTGALAVAWEGAGSARACALTGIPFVEIRGVTDSANTDAPSDFHTNLAAAMANIARLIAIWVEAR